MPNDQRRFWAAFATLYMIYSVALTSMAPGGLWQNRVFDFVMWWDNDPGGSYLAGAHELFATRGSMLFAGHPGLPMQILLDCLQRIFYFVGGGATQGLSFTAFCARHIETVWWLSRLLCSATHLGSFYCVYLFSRAVLVSPRASILATVTYATSLPVLYYVSRISPEPWMVAGFCFSFVAIWRCRDALALNSVRSALFWAGLAAIAAVSASFSKAQLMAFLPVFCLGPLVIDGKDAGLAGCPRRSSRLLGALAYCGCCLIVALAYSTLMDWIEYRRLYSELVEQSLRRLGPIPDDGSWLTWITLRAEWTWGALRVKAFRPQCSKAQLFGYCEFPLLVLAAWGTSVLLRSRETAPRFRWPLAYALLTLAAWALRSPGRAWADFHYLFIVLVIAAIAYAQIVRRLAGDLGFSESGNSWWTAVAVLTLLLHSASFWTALDSRLQDIKQYRALRIGAYYSTVRELRPGERVLVVGEYLRGFHGLTTEYLKPGRESRLVREIDDRFVEVASLPLAEQTAEGLRKRGVVRALDLSGSAPRVLAVDDWLRTIPSPSSK